MFGSERLSRAYAAAMPMIGRNAISRTAGACRPTVAASAPMPMPMLVVAAVLDAARAIPSTTPRDLCRQGGSALMISGIRELLEPKGEGCTSRAEDLSKQSCQHCVNGVDIRVRQDAEGQLRQGEKA